VTVKPLFIAAEGSMKKSNCAGLRVGMYLCQAVSHLGAAALLSIVKHPELFCRV
jgi:hypothetical protein